VWEETGLRAEAVRLCCFASERLFPQEADDYGAHFAMFVFEVQAFSGEPREQSEGPLAWFGEDELESLHGRHEIVPTDYRILKHCLERSPSLPYVEIEVVARESGSSASSLRRFEILT
jgi:hypothetical protein